MNICRKIYNRLFSVSNVQPQIGCFGNGSFDILSFNNGFILAQGDFLVVKYNELDNTIMIFQDIELNDRKKCILILPYDIHIHGYKENNYHFIIKNVNNLNNILANYIVNVEYFEKNNLRFYIFSNYYIIIEGDYLIIQNDMYNSYVLLSDKDLNNKKNVSILISYVSKKFTVTVYHKSIIHIIKENIGNIDSLLVYEETPNKLFKGLKKTIILNKVQIDDYKYSDSSVESKNFGIPVYKQ